MISLRHLIFETWAPDPKTELESKIQQLEKDLEREHPEISDLHIYLAPNNSLYIGSIRIRPEHRKQGIGRKVIQKIKDFADVHRLVISLAPQAEARYKEKLDRFYKSLGFVVNKGRNRDYQLSDPFGRTMYRRPGIGESV